MIVKFNYETISRYLEQEMIIEYDIYEMHNNEFLIYFENSHKKNISLITDNWEDLVLEFY